MILYPVYVDIKIDVCYTNRTDYFFYFLTKHGADHGCPERTVHICIKFNFDTKVAFAKSMTE